jgi:hypothetical protein
MYVTESICENWLGHAEMDAVDDGAQQTADLPEGCWHHVLQNLDPPEVIRAAVVNQTFKRAAYNERSWSSPFEQGWTPEYCVSPTCLLFVLQRKATQAQDNADAIHLP